MPPEKIVELNTLGPGEAARVVDVEGEGAFRRRLLDMGFVGGAFVRVIRHAPLRNPTEYCVSGSHVTLRSAEAARIMVAPVEEPPWKRARGGRGRGLGRWFRRGKGRGHGRGRKWKNGDEEPSQ